MKYDNYPIISTGYEEVEGRIYYYEISQPTVNLFGIKFIEIWNDAGDYSVLLFFPEHTIERRIKTAIELKHWKAK